MSSVHQLPSILDFSDYRDYLVTILEIRKSQNPTYSMGAFARDLGMNKGQMSLVLRKKRAISFATASKISIQLQFTDAELARMYDLVTLAHSQAHKMVEVAVGRVNGRVEHVLDLQNADLRAEVIGHLLLEAMERVQKTEGKKEVLVRF